MEPDHPDASADVVARNFVAAPPPQADPPPVRVDHRTEGTVVSPRMSHFFAQFGFDGTPGCLIRMDTRVYLHPQNPSTVIRACGRCAGVVWIGHPAGAGSPAVAALWDAIRPDPTLRAIHALYRRAAAGSAAPRHGTDGYMLVLAGFYAVGQARAPAFRRWRESACGYRERIPKKARFIVPAWGAELPQGPGWEAMRRIRRRRRKLGSALLVACVDAPLSRGTPAVVARKLSRINYPAHPLSPHFHANLPQLAAALAPYV